MVKSGVGCLRRRHWIHLDHINRPSNRSLGAAPLLKSSQLEIWFICFCTTPTSRAIMKCPKHAFELVLVLPWNTLLLCHYHDSAVSTIIPNSSVCEHYIPAQSSMDKQFTFLLSQENFKTWKGHSVTDISVTQCIGRMSSYCGTSFESAAYIHKVLLAYFFLGRVLSRSLSWLYQELTTPNTKFFHYVQYVEYLVQKTWEWFTKVK